MTQSPTVHRPAARTSAGQAELYGAVKAMAVRFDFKPGERINEVELARRLNVSRTPLREVLNQLMVEGFLTRSVNRGFIARLLDDSQPVRIPRRAGSGHRARRVRACQR